MTQEMLDMVVHAYCEGCQEFIGDYELVVLNKQPHYATVYVYHKDVEKIDLPFDRIALNLKPKEKSEIIIELVKQIIENGDEWLKDEESYHGDKLAERWDNERKSRLEND